MEAVDEHFRTAVEAWKPGEKPNPPEVGAETLWSLFDAQAASRHVDFAARWLQSQGKGYYTIGSAGHESNAVLGVVTRVDDPALLHYRSGGLYLARAARAGQPNPVRDLLLSLTASTRDPISGGRHKVFGHRDLHIVPQTSTIGSHLPRAVGLAYALGLEPALGHPTSWPSDAIVLCSSGDASANRSTVTGALNASSSLAHRGLDCPILFVCEDNRIGISTRSPRGWPAAMLRSIPGVAYARAAGAEPVHLLQQATEVVDQVRETRRPAVLHLDVVRLMGHAGSDVETAYRSPPELAADREQDPLLATARCLLAAGHTTPAEILGRYEDTRGRVMAEAARVVAEPHLATAAEVMLPLRLSWDHDAGDSGHPRPPVDDRPGLTLAQSITATLAEQMERHPEILVFGEDVAVKGGVYGVTRGLQKRFGAARVFDTLLDETSILGLALGTAVSGLLPVPEIQYLAYLHNAEDQLRGEAATLQFFSQGQYRNGMVIRIEGLGYQKGCGGHFHNDDSVAVLRDIPGLVIASPARPDDAAAMLHTCVAAAKVDGSVCAFLEPIALYHTRDLYEEGDGLWLAWPSPSHVPLGSARTYGDGHDLTILTWGNGLLMSLRVARRLEARGVESRVVDLRWLAPLPIEDIAREAVATQRVLVVDETRRMGGVSEGVMALLIDAGFDGQLARVTSKDSFIPLGDAANLVLLSEDEIEAAALALV